jgi:hypothetical protein
VKKIQATFIETPKGIFTAAGNWFHTTAGKLNSYAPGLFEKHSIEKIINDAEVWIRSADSLSITGDDDGRAPLGFLIGISRLSSNWLIARFATEPCQCSLARVYELHELPYQRTEYVLTGDTVWSAEVQRGVAANLRARQLSYEPRGYTNGSGFCTRCGVWASQVLPPQPQPADRRPSLLECALSGDEQAAEEIIDGAARVLRPPADTPGEGGRDDG